MSIRIMSRVFELEGMGPTHRLILLALADHADDAGRCYPSVARVCQRTGLSERAVQANLKSLQLAGFVRIETNAGPHGCNVYFVTTTPAADAPPQQVHPAADAPHPRSRCTPDPAAGAPEPSVTINEPSVEKYSAGEAFDLWNEFADRNGWAKVQDRNKSRTAAVKARIQTVGGLAGWVAALEKAEQSDFLCGRSANAWGRFGFDWMTKPANFTKLMEGNYDNRDHQRIAARNDAGSSRPGAGMAQAFATVSERLSREYEGREGGGGRSDKASTSGVGWD